MIESGCNDLKELTNEHFNKFVKIEINRGISARTINTRTYHIITLVKYFREIGMNIPLCIPLIMKLKELPPRRVSYTCEEIEEVLQNATEFEYLLIKLGFDTGMRISEITKLSYEQIHGRRINFIGKGTKSREVYMSMDCCQRLAKYIDAHNITSGRIWLNAWGYPMGVDTIRRTMKKAFIRCGHDDFYPHALRHSFGTDIQRRGADIMVIKEMMGHSNVATTERYLHGFEGQLQGLFDAYRI
ncbi:MAG: site-specific integrase [Candidatus Saccharibacteria bacterium]|nr:site-specific integrase [Candidatus Saccharibacteria bacterium]